MFSKISQKLSDLRWTASNYFADKGSSNRFVKLGLYSIGIIIILMLALMYWWSLPPSQFDPVTNAKQVAQANHQKVVPGYTSTETVIKIAQTLLNKNGGYLSNDVLPPGVWMDNMPNWEFGVIIQVRDFTRSLRNDMSRSQSQSQEDHDLAIAEPQFNFSRKSWLFPPTEREYGKGIKALQAYRDKLALDGHQDAQFYTRADNLAAWLSVVEKRLGDLSQQLSASVGQVSVDTALAGDPNAQQSTPSDKIRVIKTPWYKVDDVFYKARGETWALILLLKAVQYDFHDVLVNKNALISMQQIIRELEGTQQTVWSPIILNGSGFGIVTNHSLVMASYISRANAAIIDLNNLLNNG